MKKISYLPHTADICLLVEADSLDELFMAGLTGLNNILKEKFDQQNTPLVLKKSLIIESVDITTLLIEFLSEVLTLSYEKHALFSDFIIEELSDCQLKAMMQGAPIDTFDEDIKAVTYHEAQVVKNKQNNWETRIIFDI